MRDIKIIFGAHERRCYTIPDHLRVSKCNQQFLLSFRSFLFIFYIQNERIRQLLSFYLHFCHAMSYNTDVLGSKAFPAQCVFSVHVQNSKSKIDNPEIVKEKKNEEITEEEKKRKNQ